MLHSCLQAAIDPMVATSLQAEVVMEWGDAGAGKVMKTGACRWAR